jgi:predicted nucleic acid-binding protein
LREFYDLTEDLVFEYVNFLRRSSEIVTLGPLVIAPIRDLNDIVVMQTAIIGEADILCTKDEDFFETPPPNTCARWTSPFSTTSP